MVQLLQGCWDVPWQTVPTGHHRRASPEEGFEGRGTEGCGAHHTLIPTLPRPPKHSQSPPQASDPPEKWGRSGKTCLPQTSQKCPPEGDRGGGGGVEPQGGDAESRGGERMGDIVRPGR